MKILHTADWHIGCRTDDFLRIEEQKKKFQLLLKRLKLLMEKFLFLLKLKTTEKLAGLKKLFGKNLLNMIVFSIGLAEIPSYWKATCSKNIIINCHC